MKWHIRKLHGRWQAIRRIGNALELRWLGFEPCFYLRRKSCEVRRA